MSGETEIIIELAKDNVLKGDSEIKAIENARKQYEFALEEALTYDFKKSNKKRSKVKKSNEELIKEGDFDNLLLNNLGMIFKIADKYKNDLYYDDIVQECMATMWYAYTEFDDSKGITFATYAYAAMWKNSFKLLCELKGKIRHRKFEGFYENGSRKYKETFEIMDTLSYDNKITKNNEEDADNSYLSKFDSIEKGYNFVEEKAWLESMVKLADIVSDGERFKFSTSKILKMKLNGKTNKQIAKELGTNHMTIGRYLRRFGEYYLANRGELIC